MVPKKPRPRPGRLDNKNTRFSGFTWGEHAKLRKAIEEARAKFWPESLPTRFKIKL